jgi:hypothetical protein
LVFPWDRSQPQARVEREPVDQAGSNESGTNYNNELKQFAVCWTGDWPEKKNKPTHFTINLVCALGKVQRVGTGLTQTVPPQAPMRGLSALNGELKELRSQAQAPDELLH